MYHVVSRRITSYHAVSLCIMSSVSQSRITLYHDASHRITNPVSRCHDTGLAVIRGGPRITEATCDTVATSPLTARDTDRPYHDFRISRITHVSRVSRTIPYHGVAAYHGVSRNRIIVYHDVS